MQTARPVIRARHGVVVSGHYLATAAGLRMLHAGGNAIDAAAATCFCLNLLEPQSNGLGGEVPTLIYSARQKRAFAVSGMGWSPAALTIDWFREHGIDLVPGDGFLPACVPAVVGTWAAALSRFGTMSFSQVLEPAIDLARHGFPVYEGLHESLDRNREKYLETYPSTGEVYLPGGEAPQVGTLLRNPDWADTLETMCRAESEAGADRASGIDAARKTFYQGPIAERIVSYIAETPVPDASGESHTGMLSLDDFAEWRAEIEPTVAFPFGGCEVHKCSTWTQGPVFLQQLALLDGFDLTSMGHNSTEYIHTLMECAKLAFADREAHYGDPKFDNVPMETLLSAAYNESRRKLVGSRASAAMRPGDAGTGPVEYAARPVLEDHHRALGLDRGSGEKGVQDLGLGHAHISDTTHLDVIDAEGNMVAATPSGGWLGSSPVVPGLGFPIGTRGQMFYLNPDRPNALAPRKRPRATLTPSLATIDGAPYMAFGTPGGDMQDQATLQFFLNMIVFGMNVQEALEAPTCYSTHFPSSFYPRLGYPGQMVAERRIDADVLRALEQRGHEVVVTNPWEIGKVMGIHRNDEVIMGGASPRHEIAYGVGW